jgi:AcrR family transcriptional regulator
MAPRSTLFSQEAVRKAARELVHQKGWESLTARNVAAQLHSSVAPVYSACGSMRELQRLVLLDVRDQLEDYSRQPLSDMPFLNIGVGIVRFARDQSNLFRALFHARHGQRDIQLAFHQTVLACMQADPQLGRLPMESLLRLKDSIWLYTLGLATAIIAGIVPETSDGDILRRLKNAGNVIIFAEVAGISEAHSPENERRWQALLAEKGLPAAKKHGRPAPARSEKPGKTAHRDIIRRNK